MTERRPHESNRVPATAVRGLLLLGRAVVASPVRGAEQVASRDAATLEGVYKVRFSNSSASGQRYVSENVLEIVPHDARSAYVRVRLEFFNGHTCTLWGIARVADGKLVYQEQGSRDDGACQLEVTLKDGEVVLEDVLAPGGAHSCRSHCGARGSMSGRWPYASRRPIRYMKRLLESREYRAAVDEYQRR